MGVSWFQLPLKWVSFENCMFWTSIVIFSWDSIFRPMKQQFLTFAKTASVKVIMMVIVVFPDPLFAWLQSARFFLDLSNIIQSLTRKFYTAQFLFPPVRPGRLVPVVLYKVLSGGRAFKGWPHSTLDHSPNLSQSAGIGSYWMSHHMCGALNLAVLQLYIEFHSLRHVI